MLPNYDHVSHRTWWRELSKHLLFRSVDSGKVSCPEGAAMAERYGLPLDRSFAVTQSSDVALYRTAREIDAAARARRPRRRTGSRAVCSSTSDGSSPSRGIDYLLDAFEKVQALAPEVSLLLVGDGAEQAHYERRVARLRGVRLAGFVHERELPRYYSLADVFVFPTLGDAYGLAMDEALAAGLPVVSTASAGDVHSRIEAKGVGRVVATADADALADAMLELVQTPELRHAMSARTWDAICQNTDERYAEDFSRFVFATHEGRRRSGLAASLATAAGRVLLAAAAFPSNREIRSARPRA